METLIVICLLIVIYLLLQDKIVINKASRKDSHLDNDTTDLPEVMGRPKLKEKLVAPTNATESLTKKHVIDDNSFDPETEKEDFSIVIPQEELNEVFSDQPDFNEEEEEWSGYGEPNGEGSFATGVTFEELSTVGTLLQQERLEPISQKRAVDIIHKIHGTELFSLLESSIENASQKIARLLDKSIEAETDSGSSTLRKIDLSDFDIGEFV